MSDPFHRRPPGPDYVLVALAILIVVALLVIVMALTQYG